MTLLRTSFVTFAALALAGQLRAADRSPSRVEDLRAAKDRVARAANQTKGGAQHVLLQEQQRLNRLIDDLEHGRPVDPADVDRALQRAEQGGL
jgi:hypothetical protein